MKKRYQYRFSMEAYLSPAVDNHFFKLRVVPAENEFQRVVESCLKIEPADSLNLRSKDSFGNNLQIGSCGFSHDRFEVLSEGIVEYSDYRLTDGQPDDLFSYPSALTYTNREMNLWAHWVVSHAEGDFLLMVASLMQAVHQHLTYEKNRTDNSTTAMDVFCLRKGVCQDYAHLMVAVCRAVGLKARYVNGLVVGEGETHAWVEVYDGERWKGFDPTNNREIDCGYDKLAHGRDVNDCPTNRGQFFSREYIQEKLIINCEVKEI